MIGLWAREKGKGISAHPAEVVLLLVLTVHVAAVAFFTRNGMLLVAALWACQAVILVHGIVDIYRLQVYPQRVHK